ncbi:23S rRNA pseudouridine(2604) synthase RluF [Paenibacillus whitsoniae]|uniref:Pseudouridine synthase n=1 Tax=Paenibacillus whitsoniae TaxID=2496558 RepID=A0A3S0BG99_9BACL|nr:23S rRNA pseudouridine(2604) synthase RluF [Paenibacillus whitsoniae]RTE00022.1 23S rRNA pseudouridine(2604) synthase RluF [Paenibacillus whitsoniae]
MRINKFISETGVCSRREADKWVEARRVTINGELATLGSVVGPGDDVRIDGKPLGQKKEHVYIALNKPVGITSTTELHVPGNIVDFVGHKERIFPIGRLDKDSEGLILLTNNGDIVNQILRAENNHDKEYIVTVNRPITQMFLRGMASGVRILGTVTKPCEVIQVNERTFRIILTQGLNRQIRRMCEAFGYRVVRLQRVRIMHIHLGNLKVGKWRDLTAGEMQDLMKTLSHQGTQTGK